MIHAVCVRVFTLRTLALVVWSAIVDTCSSNDNHEKRNSGITRNYPDNDSGILCLEHCISSLEDFSLLHHT